MRGQRRLRPLQARRAESTGGVPRGDGSPAHAGASGSAAQAAAGRCEAVRHNCCNDPEARFQRAASGRVPDNPHSNTAPSNRADIAFVCLAKPAARAAEGKAIAARAPRMQKRQNWRDCAPEALVSQGESIQLVVVLLQNCGKQMSRTLAKRVWMFSSCQELRFSGLFCGS
jgi:hypothetical protein